MIIDEGRPIQLIAYSDLVSVQEAAARPRVRQPFL
jgi:hypothetical protein